MTPEYVVIFDGTDRGVMGRLLCALAPVPVSEPLTRTFPPDVKPNRRGEAMAIIRGLKDRQGLEWFTLRDIMALAPTLDRDHVKNAMGQLKLRGEIVRERKSTMVKRPPNYVQRYRFVGER
jgi:hypothetical protein